MLAADLEGLAGYDEINHRSFEAYLLVGGQIDFRFINHRMTPQQARELGMLLIEAAHNWDQLKRDAATGQP